MKNNSSKANLKPIKRQHYVEYYLIRILRIILLCMPLDMASFLMGKIWRIIAPFNTRHSRVLRHIKWAMGDEYTPAEREKIARNMWENLGRTFCESMIAERVLKNPKRIAVNEAVFRHWNEECSEGALLLTHHFGNWELSSAATVLYSDRKVLGIYKSIKNPLVEAYFLNKRKILFPGGLYSEQSGAAKKALEGVRAGYDMAMVCDLRQLRGTIVKFFDMPFAVSNFPETIAIRYKKPVFVAQLRRLKGAYFTLDAKLIDYEITGDLKQDSHNLTQSVHSEFEKWVRQNPEQWMWAPFRWNRRRKPMKKPISWEEHCKLSHPPKPNKLDN